MLIVTKSTITNGGILETRNVPRRFFGRALPLPRGGGFGLWARVLLEIQILRYLVTLMPFVGLVFVSGEVALSVSQAPVIMLFVIGVVELRILRRSKGARARLITPDEAGRRLDLLAFRARACLRQIAAKRGISEGTLHLVVEQSEFARVPPLTLVSVQAEQPEPHFLTLDADEQAILKSGLFDADLTERALHEANERQDQFLRDIVQEARGVSAHARLAAWIDQQRAVE